jgi:hypothetical protein
VLAQAIDGAAGAIEEVARIVARIRRRWPRVRILLRGDSDFAREALIAWCEANRVDFLFGPLAETEGCARRTIIETQRKLGETDAQ